MVEILQIYIKGKAKEGLGILFRTFVRKGIYAGEVMFPGPSSCNVR